MAKRSLRLSTEGIRKAKQQFAAKGWTQEYLAIEVGIKTRQPIWRFFSGDPIERFTFFELCKILDIDWRDVAMDPPAESVDLSAETSPLDAELKSLSLDDLVARVRLQRQDKINYQCGILQLLDVSRPIELKQIYTDINILESVPSQQKLDISTLDNFTPEEVDQTNLSKITKTQVSGTEAVEKYHKIRVLGKLGSGKTTFLKCLMLQCNQGTFAANQVPVFITLRDFAATYHQQGQPDLVAYIHQEFSTSDISQLAILKKLLQSGRMFICIDGMDELCPEDGAIVLHEINRFSEKYYLNQFVISRRTACQKLPLKGFTDVEIAPFTQAKINIFAQKWFAELSSTHTGNSMESAAKFMEYIKSSENRRLRRLAGTPLFLHLICSLFHHQDQFPIKHAELYKKITELILGKWDEAKGLKRPPVYPGFELPQKLKSLSEFALQTFEQGQHLFQQEVLEQYMTDFMQELLEDDTDPEDIYHATERLLQMAKSQRHGFVIERAQGVLSFSYLAIQEYLIARKIVASYDLEGSEASLQQLVTHITDPNWREIFLLTTSMLRRADRLIQLMKQEINNLVAADPYLQEFLTCTHKKLKDHHTNGMASSSDPSNPNLGLYEVLHRLNEQLPYDHRVPIPQLKEAIVTCQMEIHNQWEFTPSQERVLETYYTANQLLLDCVHSDCVVTSSIRKEIESTLLLPPTQQHRVGA
jgi:predicted NACHT family NTPase